jgi:hypothetical protein
VLGGRLDRLSRLRIRWAPLALIGLAIQIAIFSEPLGTLVGDAGPAVYVASTALVFVAVLRNLAFPGVAVIALGAAGNLAAIVANGGSMPADPAAIASIGGLPSGASNSVIVPDPVLWPLTDLFALPAWMPFANVFSVGDVLIGVGIASTIALAMRATTPATPAVRPGRES